MTVRRLKLILETIDDDSLVVLAKDAEGNDYSPAEGAFAAFYRPESNWSGEIEPEERAGNKPCAVIRPVN